MFLMLRLILELPGGGFTHILLLSYLVITKQWFVFEGSQQRKGSNTITAAKASVRSIEVVKRKWKLEWSHWGIETQPEAYRSQIQQNIGREKENRRFVSSLFFVAIYKENEIPIQFFLSKITKSRDSYKRHMSDTIFRNPIKFYWKKCIHV